MLLLALKRSSGGYHEPVVVEHVTPWLVSLQLLSQGLVLAALAIFGPRTVDALLLEVGVCCVVGAPSAV